MVEPLAVVASWTTPTALFVLLNLVIGFIAITSAFASRKHDHQPPPEHHQIHHYESPQKQLLRAPSLFSRVTSFNFSGNSCDETAALPPENQPQFAPAPSFLSRMTSFNSLYLHRSVEPEMNPTTAADDVPPQQQPAANIARAPPLLARMTSFSRFSLSKSSELDIDPPVSTDVKQSPISQAEPEIARAPSLLSRMASMNFSLHRSTESVPDPAPVEAREQHVTRSNTEPKKKKKKRVPPAGNKMKKSSSEKAAETASFGHEEVDAKADDFINRFKQQLRLQRLDSLLRCRNSAG